MRKVSSRYIISQLSIVFALIVILQSAGPWFLWGNTFVGNIAILLFLISRFLLLKRIPSKIFFFLLPLYIFCVWMGIYQAERIMQPIVFFVKRFLPFFFIIIMSQEEKLRLKNTVINSFSTIVLISLLAYIAVVFVGIPLQPIKMEHPMNTWYPPFLNYYFFVTEFSVGEFIRFRSIFTEPGHLGMFCALFLYINGYSLKKWQNVILLVALLLSLSLAAYVLLFLGWVIYQAASGVSLHRIFRVVLLLGLSIGLGWLYIAHGPKENALSILILDRLEYDEDRGIKGNNRNSQDFMLTYKELSTSELLLGKGNSYMKDRFANTANSSYRNFVMVNGFIGLILMFFLFLSVVYLYPSRIALGMFLLFSLSFLQRPYWLWEIESWMYLSSVSLFAMNQKPIRKCKLSLL